MKLFKRKKEEKQEKEWIYYSPIHRVSKLTGIRQIGTPFYQFADYPKERESYDGTVSPEEYFSNIEFVVNRICNLTIGELKQAADDLNQTVKEKREEYLQRKKLKEHQENERRKEALKELSL